MDLDEFQQILNNFQQNDDELVKQTTEFYDSALSENPSDIIALHFQNILSFSSQNLVAMSIILLKNAFNSRDQDFLDIIFCNKELIDLIAETLPSLFENENFDSYLFSLLVNTSSLIASIFIEQKCMLDFIPKLIEIVKTMSPTLSPPAIDCIVQCNNIIPLINYQKNEEDYEYSIISLEDVHSIISSAFTSDVSIEFMTSALRMLFSFYIDIDQTPQLIDFAQAVSEVYLNIPEKELTVALNDLYLFCQSENNYIYFSQTLPDLISTLLSIVENNNENEENGLHIQAIVISIYICLAKKFDIKFKQFLVDVTESIMIASCHFPEEIDNDDIDSNAPLSDVAIFFLSEIFSSRTDYQSLVIKRSQEIIQEEEWKCRRSALAAIYQLLLSCETGLDVYFDEIYAITQEHFEDSNEICRYYSFKAFSELCKSYSNYVSQYVQSLIPSMISILNDEVFHQAKIAELESIESICSNISSEFIIPIAESVIEDLMPQIQNEDSTPMEQLMVIKCISKISLSTQINFDQFYSDSMDWLKTAIDQIKPGTEDPIRIQTIVTIPLIGKIVDLELFLDDGVEFLNFLLQDDFSIPEENEKKSILFAIQEMSEILPLETYSQFLPSIFSLLEAVLSEEFEVEKIEQYDVLSLSDKVTIKDQNQNIIIAYSRSQLSLKNECINVMIKLAENLNEVVIPYIRPVSKIVSNFIAFAPYPPLQSSSLSLFDSLIILYRKFDPDLLSNFLPYVRNILFSTVSILFSNSISVLCECFYLLAHSMEGSKFDVHYTSILVFLQQLRIKRVDAINKNSMRQDYGPEEEDISVFNENSPDLVSLDNLEISIEKFVNVLLERFTQDMLAFSPILRHSECHIFNVLYMTDLFIIMKDDESNFIDLDELLSIIFESIDSSRMNLSYAAFISLSKIIQNIEVDSDLIEQSIDKINTIIQQYEGDENDLPHKVIDGALIALSAIFKIVDEKTDISSNVKIWFEEMPVLTDDPDSNVAFEVLANFFGNKNQQIFNPDSITHLLRCCSVAISMKHISDEIKDQIITLLKELFSDEEMHDKLQESICSLVIQDRKFIQNVIN